MVVVGGGIFGVSAALALAENGCTNVTLLEKGQVASANTALAAGILSYQTWNAADAQLIHETRQRVEALTDWAAEAGLPAARTVWHPVGGVAIAPAHQRPLLEGMATRTRELGVEVELLSGTEGAGYLPHLHVDPDEHVLVTPGDGYLESTDLADLARRRAESLGVRFRENTGVRAVAAAGARVESVELADGSRLPAAEVVLACGAWTKPLAATAGAALPAIPYRTQLMAVDLPGADQTPVVHDVVQGFYTRAESGLRMLAGDGTVLREFDPETHVGTADQDFIEATSRRIVHRFKEGKNAHFRNAWAGLCVGTPDRRPLAGSAGRVRGLWVLTGDNGFGVMRGLALGALVANLVTGRKEPRLPGVDPRRFGHRPRDSFPLAEGFNLHTA